MLMWLHRGFGPPFAFGDIPLLWGTKVKELSATKLSVADAVIFSPLSKGGRGDLGLPEWI